MPAKIVEVRPFELRYGCDGKAKPGCDGVLQNTGEVLQMRPPMFKHVCPKCKETKFLDKPYPQLIGIAINDPIPEAWLPMLDADHVRDMPPSKKILLS